MLTPIYRYLNMTAAMMFFCAALVAGLKAAGVIPTTPDVRDVLGRAEFEILKRRGALRGVEGLESEKRPSPGGSGGHV